MVCVLEWFQRTDCESVNAVSNTVAHPKEHIMLLPQSLSYYQAQFMSGRVWYRAGKLSLDSLKFLAFKFLVSLIENKKEEHWNFVNIKNSALNYLI